MTLSYLSSAPRIHDRPPQAPDPVAPTNAAGLAEEWRTLLLPAHLLARAPRLARVPRGDGGPVIDIPGWKAPEASMAPLRAYLRAVGHDAHGWGLGVNTGHPERDTEILADQVAARHEQTGRKVALVGWSLGGVIARETARTLPHAVSRVITYGTPAIGGPTYTLGARAFGRSESDRIRSMITELDRQNPIQGPDHRNLHPQGPRRELAGLHRPHLSRRRTHRGSLHPRRHGPGPQRVAGRRHPPGNAQLSAPDKRPQADPTEVVRRPDKVGASDGARAPGVWASWVTFPVDGPSTRRGRRTNVQSRSLAAKAW